MKYAIIGLGIVAMAIGSTYLPAGEIRAVAIIFTSICLLSAVVLPAMAATWRVTYSVLLKPIERRMGEASRRIFRAIFFVPSAN